MAETIEGQSQCGREIIVEQILWLIKLRWVAVAGIVVASLVGSYVVPVLISTTPIYICAGVLFLSNIFYYCVATRKVENAGRRDVILGMIQVEADLVILTAVLHFSGGVANPFFMFYIFHIIIATIILPRNLSYAVGLTAIAMFGLLAVAKLEGWAWLGYYPLRFSTGAGLWRNPVYVTGAFIAFAFTVLLAQYLMKIIITRMTAKELEAARNNDVLNAVISAMAEGLIFVTQDSEIAICNPAAKLWKKDGAGERGGDRVEDFTETLSGYMKGLIQGDQEKGRVGRVIEFGKTGSEARHIEANSSRVIGIDGQELGYVIVGQDLTEHKKLEKDLLEQTETVTAINEMLKMSRVKMAQREKMVAIGQMAAGIAHEIGNPLASLSSVAQYLGRSLKTHEEKENLLLIEYQVNRISNILKRMLTLARPATAEYTWTDINESVSNVLSLLKFDKRMQLVEVKDVTSCELPMVWLNPQAFEQVLLNISINALDAMITKGDQQQHSLQITRELVNEMVEVRISDTGVGMSQDVCKRAFESFFTTKEIGKGTGLGLFISYNLVAELDGTIEMESEVGRGTTVIIRIPVQPKKDLIGTDVEKKEATNYE